MFVAGKVLVVESSYKAANGFLELSQSDIGELDLASSWIPAKLKESVHTVAAEPISSFEDIMKPDTEMNS